MRCWRHPRSPRADGAAPPAGAGVLKLQRTLVGDRPEMAVKSRCTHPGHAGHALDEHGLLVVIPDPIDAGQRTCRYPELPIVSACPPCRSRKWISRSIIGAMIGMCRGRSSRRSSRSEASKVHSPPAPPPLPGRRFAPDQPWATRAGSPQSFPGAGVPLEHFHKNCSHICLL